MRLLITAGPTHEPIDDVRYLANRSTGRMGLALTGAAAAAGCDVTLLLGPVSLDAPPGVTVHRFETAADLARLLDEHFPACDVLIMAAAVADYTPQRVAGKLPRQDGKLVLELEPTADLVAACAARKMPRQRIIGFALEEPGQLDARAAAKLAGKRLDAIVANPLTTMGAADIEPTILTAAGDRLAPGPMTKPAFAAWLIRYIMENASL